MLALRSCRSCQYERVFRALLVGFSRLGSEAILRAFGFWGARFDSGCHFAIPRRHVPGIRLLKPEKALL